MDTVRRRRLRARGKGCRGEREAATQIARLYPALEQAMGDAGENIPVVLHRAIALGWPSWGSTTCRDWPCSSISRWPRTC